MKLLLLGGTGFLSGHLVVAALSRGHEVTLFHRGRTNPDRFPEVEHILGDRERDLELLKGRRWDAAIDPSGYLPRIVEASSTFLSEAVDHYTFISSMNAYADCNTEFVEATVDESSRLATLPEGASEEITFETYGPYKVLCEQAAERAMPGRVLIIRPGLMVGPADASGRFTYWPRRIARGGEVLAPGVKDRPLEFVDARDVAAWIILLLERRQIGIYNAGGPGEHLTMQSFLELTASALGAQAQYTWVSDPFLSAHDVTPWTELPLWIPQDKGTFVLSIDFQKAINAGFTFRPLAQTIQDVLAWDAAHPDFPLQNVTLSSEKEATLLRAWHEQHPD
jgi:2'-hydroxyisoflavone reductase